MQSKNNVNQKDKELFSYLGVGVGQRSGEFAEQGSCVH